MRTLVDDLGFLIARTDRTMRGYLFRRLKRLGVTFEQFQVVIGLCEGDDIPQHVLADRMSLEPSSMARLLRRMECAGLVVRVEDEVDSRVRRVRLTDQGRSLLEGMIAIREETLSEVLECLTEKEVHEFKRLLNTIFYCIGKLPQDSS
jgi:MarR family transcriptional regulator for hemolysin